MIVVQVYHRSCGQCSCSCFILCLLLCCTACLYTHFTKDCTATAICSSIAIAVQLLRAHPVVVIKCSSLRAAISVAAASPVTLCIASYCAVYHHGQCSTQMPPILSTSIMLYTFLSAPALICFARNSTASAVPSAYMRLPQTLCLN
jgi:hypothetical protein